MAAVAVAGNDGSCVVELICDSVCCGGSLAGGRLGLGSSIVDVMVGSAGDVPDEGTSGFNAVAISASVFGSDDGVRTVGEVAC